MNGYAVDIIVNEDDMQIAWEEELIQKICDTVCEGDDQAECESGECEKTDALVLFIKKKLKKAEGKEKGCFNCTFGQKGVFIGEHGSYEKYWCLKGVVVSFFKDDKYIIDLQAIHSPSFSCQWWEEKESEIKQKRIRGICEDPEGV